MNIFLIISLACAIYGIIAKKEEFIQFGIFILAILVVPRIVSLVPFIQSPLQRRLLNWMLIMLFFSFIGKRYRGR